MSSPFASRLGTNYSAQDKEIDEIKALLVEPSQKLKRLNDEIDVMRKALDKLVEERDILSTYVDAHQALLSPVRRLHLDILEAIFMACLPTHRNCVMSAQEAPVLLGRMCSSWRAISLKTPRLWSRLHIVEPNYPYNSPLGVYQSKVEQRLEVADAWLRRSKTCPLSISLESSFDYITPPMSTSDAQPFLDILIPFASRWQNISLAISLPGVQTLLRLGENEVPLLKSLTINERRDNPHHIPHAEWTVPQGCVVHAPGLTSFSLLGRNVHSLDLPLHWGRLTALTLMGSGLSSGWGPGGSTVNPQTCRVVLDILSRCSELRACTLLVHAPLDEHLQDLVVECPFLHTFDLSCDETPLYVADRLLGRLSLPQLRDFKLRGAKPGATEELYSTFSADSVLSFLTTLTQLESISADSAMFPKPILINFLRALPPTVLRLAITEPMWRRLDREDAIFDDEVLEALTTFPDRPSYCPALQEVVVHYCPNLSDEALLRFIMSRPTLKLIDIEFDRERKVDILPSLEPFTEAGLKTSISYKTRPPSEFSPWQGLPDAPLTLWGSP